MKKSTFLHLRFPFSFFLLPVFLFAVAIPDSLNWTDTILIFFILHFLLYPASNGYNSYFDKDEGSIGGLKHPPKVSLELFRVSWIMDILALMLGLIISWQFSLMLFIYGMVSKAYSHPSVRLKSKPLLGWLAAGIFQGYFTMLMVYLGLVRGGFEVLLDTQIQYAGLLSTLLLSGSYPMTQVYQHEEDGARGDRTISLMLGIRGTFHFTAAFFTVSVSLFAWYFYVYNSFVTAGIFLAVLFPVLVYFGYWYLKVRQDTAAADYERTMRLNLISSTCLNLFFAYLIVS